MKNFSFIVFSFLFLTACTKENINKIQNLKMGDKLTVNLPIKSLIKLPEPKTRRATQEELNKMRPVDRKLYLIVDRIREASGREYRGPNDPKEKRKFILRRSLEVNSLQIQHRIIQKREAPEYNKYTFGLTIATIKSLQETRKKLKKQLADLESQ